MIQRRIMAGNGSQTDEHVNESDEVPLLSSQHDEEFSTMLSSTSYKPKFAPQYFAAFSATLGAFAMGTVLGYSSPAGAILTNNSTQSSIHLTSTENSWFSSICNLGALVGALIGGMCINRFGRKGVMLQTLLPMLFGWGLIVGAQNFTMLILGRILTGFAAGLISIAVPTYIAEFSSAEIRGVLGSGFQLMIVIGVMFTFSMGAATSNFRVIAGACCIFPVAFGVLMSMNKESPVYLMSLRREQDAVDSLTFFRGKDFPGLTTELGMIRESLEKSSVKKASFSDLALPHIRKPLTMSLLLFVFQQFSGINSVLFNLETIFAEAGTDMSQTLNSIVVGAMQVIATLIGALLMDKAGRKVLLVVSASVMAISLAALGAFFYLKSISPEEAASVTWIPLTSLIVFTIAFSVGYGPIPWLMMGELFSPEVKELASSLAASTNWSLAFLTTFLFAPLQVAIHDYGVYWLFGVLCFINVFYVIFFVFETKGKTLHEINAHFGAFRNVSNEPEIV